MSLREAALGKTGMFRHLLTSLASIFAGQKQAGRFNDTKNKAGRWVLALEGMIHTWVRTDTLNMDFLGPGSKVILAE